MNIVVDSLGIDVLVVALTNELARSGRDCTQQDLSPAMLDSIEYLRDALVEHAQTCAKQEDQARRLVN